jgi:Fe2+ transport system protein FeoA
VRMAKPGFNGAPSTLAEVASGQPVAVTHVGAEEAVLLAHGIRTGVRLVVEGDAPFRGPRIVRHGSARIAIDRRLAGHIQVQLIPDATRNAGR